MFRIFIAILCFMSIATTAHAQNTWQSWGEAGWWHIGWNTDDEGCGYYATYTNNVSLRINVHEDDTGDFVLFLPGSVLKNGMHYKVYFFDARGMRGKPEIVANVVSDKDLTATVLESTVSLKFLQAVSRAHNVTIYAGKKQVAQLLLTGSQSAFAQALQCKERPQN